jgi:hypothetical protein
MDIDVIVFTPSAPVWHIQGHTLHLYIIVNATVSWFGPIPPVGYKNGYRHDMDDVNAYAMVPTDVTISVKTMLQPPL